MNIIPEILLADYKNNFPKGLEEKFEALHDDESSSDWTKIRKIRDE